MNNDTRMNSRASCMAQLVVYACLNTFEERTSWVEENREWLEDGVEGYLENHLSELYVF